MLKRKKRITDNVPPEVYNYALFSRKGAAYVGSTKKFHYIKDMKDGYIINVLKKHSNGAFLRGVTKTMIKHLKYEMLWRDTKEFKEGK